MDRYSRQILLDKIGAKGQSKLADAKVAVIGLGGTGGLIAQLLARLGVGTLIIVDPDYVSLDNLHRQLLFREEDVGKLKVEVAANFLASINSDIKIEKVYQQFSALNAETIVNKVDIVMDGTDNFLTRFIINDACVKLNKPWVYTAAISYYGTVMPIIPGKTACLRCLIRDLPVEEQKCSEIGVLNTVPSMIASIAVSVSIKILLGYEIKNEMYYIDGWNIDLDKIQVLRNDDCQACQKRNFEYLSERYYKIKSSC
ncbi:MAG: HesA/MoeB/ThiF family protein [Thermoplasmata archaeon]